VTRGHGLLSRTARAFTRLDSIVTVVDAKHLLAQLDDSHEAVEQIAFADTILLNKIDLLSPEELDAVEARLRRIGCVADSGRRRGFRRPRHLAEACASFLGAGPDGFGNAAIGAGTAAGHASVIDLERRAVLRP
jgi:CobW/HypB/UreG, nucleotide-binding domain